MTDDHNHLPQSKVPQEEPRSEESAAATVPVSETPPVEKESVTSPTPSLEPQKEQQRNRSENQDYLRVLSMYGGAVPSVYINHVSVEKDMHIGTGRTHGDIFPPPERDSAEIPSREIQKIKQVYERPAMYAQALKTLLQERCVVLLGKPQIGKRTMAIHLALDVRVDNAPIYELSPEENPVQQIKSAPSPLGTIYIVDSLLYAQARGLKSFEMNALLDLLEKRQCYLIITAQTGAVFPPELRICPVKPPEIPATLLVEKHLSLYQQFSRTQIESVLSDPALTELLNKELSPAQADQLAERLAQGLKSNAPVEEALHGFAEVVADTVRQWFDEVADDIETAAFRIALAVFNGAQVTEVQKAAQILEHLLRPDADGAEKTAISQPLASPFKRETLPTKLARARARLVERTVMKTYSDTARINVVELEDESYSKVLLAYIWEFAELRPFFLKWLCDYAVNAPSDMRLRAAGALGALAGLDFEYITHHVFYKWSHGDATDPDLRRRYYQALGNAFGVLIWNDERAEDVLGLLRAWVEDGHTAHKWAAARAYAQVGLRYPREALHRWRHILESEASFELRLTDTFGISIPHPLHMSVIDALLSLFLRAVEMPHRLRPVYEQALDGIAAWVAEDAEDKNSEHVGLPIFLALTAIRYPLDNHSDPETWPPAMLRIVGTQPDSNYRRTLAELLRCALRTPRTRALAIDALKGWVDCAESDPWLEEVLTLLLTDLLQLPATSHRERGILEIHLRRLANHPRQPSDVAKRLLPKLSKYLQT